MRVVNSTLSSNFIGSNEANKAQSMIKDKGKHTLIDKVQVRYVSDDDKHWAELKNFGHKFVHIPEHFLREYDRLLMGGIWAQVEIRHQYDEEQNESREERFIGVPEQGGRDMIATDPLAPGSVYTASVDDQGKVGLYRLEVGCSSGTGKLKIAGGVEGPMKESLQRAFGYMQSQKVKLGIGQQFDTTDFHVEAIDSSPAIPGLSVVDRPLLRQVSGCPRRAHGGARPPITGQKVSHPAPHLQRHPVATTDRGRWRACCLLPLSAQDVQRAPGSPELHRPAHLRGAEAHAGQCRPGSGHPAHRENQVP